MTTTNLTIRPFSISVPQSAIDDLHRRLDSTRYAATPPGDDWTHGTPTDYLRDMAQQWRAFDWNAYQERLNRRPGYTTEIEGQTLFFQHVRSERPDATPLLLLHTYPGSFAEFDGMIDALVAPPEEDAPAFHLVIPSLPGFPFSQPLADGDWPLSRVATAVDALMRGLGYDSYGAHGSDVGAMVARELAMLAPEGFRGAHVLQLFSFPSGDPSEFATMTPEDYAALEFAGWFNSVNGYAKMNAARPDTIAAALSDSPVGQLAYNELFQSFGNGTSLVTPEQILEQNSLYWLTNATAAVVRYHYAERDAERRVNDGPIGVTVFADDFRSMRPFAERDNTNIVSWTHQPRGGHFAMLEVPGVLAQEIRGFFNAR